MPNTLPTSPVWTLHGRGEVSCHLAQHDRVEVDSIEVKVTLDKFVAAAEKAREAGDQAGVDAVLAAFDRIEDGESAEVVYLEWLRARQPAQVGDGATAGR